MTPTPDGVTELFTMTTDRALPITGLLQGTDRRQDTDRLLQGTDRLPRGTDLHRGTGLLTLADLRAANLREPGHRDRRPCHHPDRRHGADKEN